jgi:hypothetical protein
MKPPQSAAVLDQPAWAWRFSRRCAQSRRPESWVLSAALRDRRGGRASAGKGGGVGIADPCLLTSFPRQGCIGRRSDAGSVALRRRLECRHPERHRPLPAATGAKHLRLPWALRSPLHPSLSRTATQRDLNGPRYTHIASVTMRNRPRRRLA